MESLLEDLRRLTAGNAPYDAPNATAPRVLLLTGHGMWSRDKPLMDGVLFHALRQRGADCLAILCGAAMPACFLENVATHSPEALLSRGEPDICATCVGQGSDIFEALGVPFRTISGALRPDDLRRTGEVVAAIPFEEYFDYRDDGVDVGGHARASMMRYLLSGRVSDDPIDRSLAERFMVSALLVQAAAHRVIDEFQPDVIVANHGLYNIAGVFADVAARDGVRTVAWNRGYRKNTVIFSHGKSYHYEMMDEPTSEWEHGSLTPEEKGRLDDYLTSRQRGTMDWITVHPNPIEDRDVLIRTVGLDPARPVIGLFTNVNWDAQMVYPQHAFPDQLAWLVQTIEHFGSRPDLQLVIREHPGETKALAISRQRMADEIRTAFPVLPPNVHIIPAENDLSSYTLADLIDAGIIFSTKFGIEMAVRGVPVIVAGDAWIRGKGFAHDASTREEYDEILQHIDQLPRLSPALVDRARLYANHFFFRRMIPVPLELGGQGEDSATVTLHTLDELRPGKDPAIDVICSGILEGAHFVHAG